MLHLPRVLPQPLAWLLVALAWAPAAGSAGPPQLDKLGFLGVSKEEQADPKLSELVNRRLARMGEPLVQRTRARPCKDIECFSEQAQTSALNQAHFLLNAEVYESDASQQNITVRVFDAQRGKLESMVETCEHCDDERRSDLILVGYSQLKQRLAPLSVQDICPNIDGTQGAVPEGMNKDRDGNCLLRPPPASPQTPEDLCTNIVGVQTAVPTGMVKDKFGNCLLLQVGDLCPNIDGVQVAIPRGIAKVEGGDCIVLWQGEPLQGGRRSYIIGSAMTGGAALLSLVVGLAGIGVYSLGDTACVASSGSTDGSCGPSYVMMAVGLAGAAVLGGTSVGLSIPLWKRKE